MIMKNNKADRVVFVDKINEAIEEAGGSIITNGSWRGFNEYLLDTKYSVLKIKIKGDAYHENVYKVFIKPAKAISTIRQLNFTSTAKAEKALEEFVQHIGWAIDTTDKEFKRLNL